MVLRPTCGKMSSWWSLQVLACCDSKVCQVLIGEVISPLMQFKLQQRQPRPHFLLPLLLLLQQAWLSMMFPLLFLLEPLFANSCKTFSLCAIAFRSLM
eukprot:g31114.t1